LQDLQRPARTNPQHARIDRQLRPFLGSDRRGTGVASTVCVLFEPLPVQLHFLPDNVRVEDVVRRTRSAAHAFLTSGAHRWGRTKLRSWLIVEYAMATEWTREDEVSPWLHRDARMDDERVREIVEDARRRMTRLLVHESSGWRTPGFAAEMIDRGLITCVTDSSGREAYAPAARVDLSFVERVASIFIADFLAHPADYRDLSACECCGELQMGERAQHHRDCVKVSPVRPPPASGVCLRELAETTPARAAYVAPMRRSG
jgi:hypothetical protein